MESTSNLFMRDSAAYLQVHLGLGPHYNKEQIADLVSAVKK